MNSKVYELIIKQYGLLKRWRYINSSSGVKCLANSIPKSGTNLLTRALYLHPELSRSVASTITYTSSSLDKISAVKNNCFVVGHLYYTTKLDEVLQENSIKNILMIRDPRDVLLSKMKFIFKNKKHYLHQHFKDNFPTRLLALHALLDGFDFNGKDEMGLLELYKKYLDWSDSNNCMLVRFEDLSGALSGGSVILQHTTLKKIYDYLGVSSDDSIVEKVSDNVYYTKSKTFEKGLINRGRKELPDVILNKLQSNSNWESILKTCDYQ